MQKSTGLELLTPKIELKKNASLSQIDAIDEEDKSSSVTSLCTDSSLARGSDLPKDKDEVIATPIQLVKPKVLDKDFEGSVKKSSENELTQQAKFNLNSEIKVETSI